jgi:hypothetical protein
VKRFAARHFVAAGILDFGSRRHGCVVSIAIAMGFQLHAFAECEDGARRELHFFTAERFHNDDAKPRKRHHNHK